MRFFDAKEELSECYLYNRKDFVKETVTEPTDPSELKNYCFILKNDPIVGEEPSDGPEVNPTCKCTEIFSQDGLSCIPCDPG